MESSSKDFASLLDEIRAEYPVVFIGSINLMHLQTDPAAMRNFKALDGFMEYGLYRRRRGHRIAMRLGHDGQARSMDRLRDRPTRHPARHVRATNQ
jgi:hypothetical protein